MHVFFYLSSCSTCIRIMKDLHLDSSIEKIDIKKNPITLNQLNELYKLTQSYEALFNKRAQLFKQKDFKNQVLRDEDYRDLILEHYTFLKRPVFIYDENIFIGNTSRVTEAAKVFLYEQ